VHILIQVIFKILCFKACGELAFGFLAFGIMDFEVMNFSKMTFDILVSVFCPVIPKGISVRMKITSAEVSI